MENLDPYSAPAGYELDAWIHRRVFKRDFVDACPSYSTNSTAAGELKKTVEQRYETRIETGHTRLKNKKWFARYEMDPGNPTEVLAETYSLAVSRLTVLLITRVAANA